MRLILLTLSMLFSCQQNKAKDPSFVDESIAAKARLYKSLYKGWAHDKCDSVKFTAICKMSGGCSEANLYDAETNGRWFRSPEKDCFDLGQSKSDISKDMFVGIFNYLWSVQDKAALKRIYDYGSDNNWIMGRYQPTADGLARVLMTPSMSVFLAEMVGVVRTQTMVGFEDNLDALWIYLRGTVRGSINDLEDKRIRDLAKSQPRNALFHAVKSKFDDGDQSKAIAILLDQSLFPADRLPTSSDRCEEYLWQRDDGKDWLPCDKARTHDGVDFLVAAFIAGQI